MVVAVADRGELGDPYGINNSSHNNSHNSSHKSSSLQTYAPSITTTTTISMVTRTTGHSMTPPPQPSTRCRSLSLSTHSTGQHCRLLT